MAGIDMVLSAALKAAGFSKEQFQEGMNRALSEYEFIKNNAVEVDARIKLLETRQLQMLEILLNVEAHLITASHNRILSREKESQNVAG
jgi:hypothetical protein